MTGLLALARITALGAIADTAYAIAAWAETARDLTDDWTDIQEETHR